VCLVNAEVEVVARVDTRRMTVVDSQHSGNQVRQSRTDVKSGRIKGKLFRATENS
jgi:hypothetical protein